MNQSIESPTIIFAGGGGHALSLLEAAPADSVAGYLAPQPATSMPVPLLGNDADASRLSEEGYLFHIAFVYAGLPLMFKRRRLIEIYENAGAKFAPVIARSAVVTPNSLIGKGCAVLNLALVNRARLGDHVIVNSGAIVEHDCSIGSNTFIGPGAVIGGGVSIGDDCFVGLGAKIKNGITIAPGVTVGIGVTVDRDLTEPGICHGTPMKFHAMNPRWK